MEASIIRLDYLMNICEKIKNSKELADILGSPVEKHVGLVLYNRLLEVKEVTPTGDQVKEYTPEQLESAQKIVMEILRSSYGSEGLPQLR